jgi:hypothetical protein
MKVLLLGLLAAFATAKWADQDCPEAKQVLCIDDVRNAYEPCKKAAEAGGSDMIADLACMKYYNKMKSECWPCICGIAKIDHVPIKGCLSVRHKK